MKKRILLFAVLALAAAAFVVPRIDADRYRDRIHATLEKELGRKVEIGEVRFRLLPMPGLTVANVTIGEDPKFGAEPVAYVTTLVAAPRIKSLFGGPLEFASVDLQDASLNLTRVDRGENEVSWNFGSLLRKETLAAFPSIHMSGGRINFKFGDMKSLFYLLNTDVDLWPPDSAQGPWTLRVHAQPSRTDRPAGNGFGSFMLRGQWFPANSSTTLDVKLEQSELGDMLTLLNGTESGIHGDVSGDAHLSGPLNRIGIAGRMTISDVHGWSQTPPGGSGWRLAIGGAIDAPGQTMDLNAKVAGAQSPLDLRYRVTDYLRRPRWGVTVNLNHFPLTPMPDIARNLGWPLPADFKLDGTANGAVGYSMPDGPPRMDGTMNLTNSTFVMSGAPALHIPGAELHFSGSRITLEATEVTNDSKETAAIAGSWDVGADVGTDAGAPNLDIQISSDGMSIASLKKQILVAGIPLLSNTTSGTWKGDLRYSDNAWSGNVNLTDAEIPFEAFAEPIHIASADATIDGEGLSLKRVNLTLGGIAAQGEYRYDAGAARPHKFRITVPEASGPALEKLLMPTLRRGNFLTYAFNFGRVPQPDWLRNMRADGTIQTGQLDLGGGHFTKVRARVLWNGMNVQLTNLSTQFGEAAFAGAATIHLAGRQPGYNIQGKVSGIEWHGGTISANGTLATSGTGAALLSNIHAQGTLDGQDVDLGAPEAYDSVTGTFDWTWPKLRLPQLVMKSGAETSQGSAETGDNGQLLLKVNDVTKHIQVAGQ
ncbi:MAG TPA: AsmA family protein [Bryobacteraceae bacterium]|nr:AsmA family protein [Bryobacteraceae bacterium]